MTIPKQISFLYTNIGRGHPSYLDGIIESIGSRSDSAATGIQSDDVFSVSHGLARLGWKAVRQLYRRGSGEGLRGSLYNRLRRNGSSQMGGVATNILGRDIRRKHGGENNLLVVAHPLLVAILRGRPNLVYQHGEPVAPRESLVKGASLIFAPTEEVAERFVSAGYAPAQVVVTGLCIEPALVAQAERAYRARVSRLRSGAPLTGLVVSSGAEPREHITRLISSITSCVKSDGRAIVVARSAGRLASETAKLSMADRSASGGSDRCKLLTFLSRAEENEQIANHFGEVDFLVAPPHERTNWALGLGLPMFALTPTFGPFAPLNLDLLLRSGSMIALKSRSEAVNLGTNLTNLRRSGRLSAMAEAGWGRYAISGFEAITAHLLDRPGPFH